MNALKTCSTRILSNAPGRLYRALPAVVLGTMFNVLDTVSTGLLLFPQEEGSGPTQFKALQIQGLSMYIMSTILSQVAMTLGGSRFPGALGAMLIEILPFLRGVGSDIRNTLGSDNPALVPTVMAAYALTSFLTGFVFIVLGLLKLGNLVAYFPQTVLTGAIGAIGVSLFVLGLGLTLPETSPELTLSSAGNVLFAKSHLPLLAASFLPSFILSVSKRSQFIARWTRGAVHNAYYIPLFLLSVPVFFWIIVSAARIPHETLVTHGWLFRVDTTAAKQSGIGTSWIYWREFDFPKVEWWALKSATLNIILLVVIGVLNLPIYVPALAFSLDVSYDMNHEFLGQGAANILAGIAGTVPNILQYSYSVFVTRANGGRFEMAIVTLLTFILFLTSSLLLPYIPTILASALVLFLGIELFLEAVWESAMTLVLLEWGVVMGTLIACTFLGFAEGFGVGIGTAALVYLVYGVVDSGARAMQWEEWNEMHRHQRSEDRAAPLTLISPHNLTPSSATSTTHLDLAASTDIETSGARSQYSLAHHRMMDLENDSDADFLHKIGTRAIVLSGYVFFASIPTLESQLLSTSSEAKFIIVDLTLVHRLETAAAQCFDRAVRDLAPRSTVLVLCGVRRKSGVCADFGRAGVELTFYDDQKQGENAEQKVSGKGVLVFESRMDSVRWCQRQYQNELLSIAQLLTGKGTLEETQTMLREPDALVYDSFRDLFDFRLRDVLRGSEDSEKSHPTDSLESKATSSDMTAFLAAGARFGFYAPGQMVAPQCTDTGKDSRIIFLVEGQIALNQTAVPYSRPEPSRPSLQRLLMTLPQKTLLLAKQGLVGMYTNYSSRLRSLFTRREVSGDILMPGAIVDCGLLPALPIDSERHEEDVSPIKNLTAISRCVTVEIGHNSSYKAQALMDWASDKSLAQQ